MILKVESPRGHYKRIKISEYYIHFKCYLLMYLYYFYNLYFLSIRDK